MGKIDYVAFSAQRIADLRVQKDISANEMSYAMDRGKNYIQTIELQRANPSFRGFFEILDFLNVAPADFFDPEYKYYGRIEKLVNNLKKLDDADLATIELMAERLAAKSIEK